jgi:hypothetical protein
MALRNQHEHGKRISEDYLSSTISSSTLEIVLDDRSLSDSGDEYSNDQLGYNILLEFFEFYLFILIKDNHQPVRLVMNVKHIKGKNICQYEFVLS